MRPNISQSIGPIFRVIAADDQLEVSFLDTSKDVAMTTNFCRNYYMGVAGRKWLVAQPGGLTLLIVGLTARALPVIKREPTSVAIIARWLQVSHTAFSYSTYTDDTSLAIADDLGPDLQNILRFIVILS